MKKGHRRVHHLFWYLAVPILIAFLLGLPVKTDESVGESAKPSPSGLSRPWLPIAIIP